MDRKEEAWVVLQLIPEITRPRFYDLLKAFGSPEAALGASAGQLARIGSLDDAVVARIVNYRDAVDLDSEYRLIEEAGVELHDEDEETEVARFRSFLESVDPEDFGPSG